MRPIRTNCWLALWLASVFFSTAGGQETATTEVVNWRAERAELDQEYSNRLEDIANDCNQNDIEQRQVAALRTTVSRDLGRQYIFLPSERSMPIPAEGIAGQCQAKINELNTWQAERILELAKRAAEAEAASTAFQLLNEVLYFNKDHTEVRKILGHRKTDDGWRVAPERIKDRPATRDHDLLNWPVRSYRLVTTPHFEIESNASEERTRYLAEKLERWHSVWRQVFFEYWSNSKTLQRWIDGKSSYRHSKKRFRVVFFADRTSYLQQLGQFVPGVEVSTGYYSPDYRISFFYDSPDEAVEETWRHELTHQLFRETIRTESAFEDEYIWLNEGIAIYTESLADFGEYVTLGGFDSRRAQYARIRMRLEPNSYVAMNELAEIGRSQLQQRSDIARLYGQAAGLTDMLMNDEQGAMQPRLIEFLRMIYTGRKIKNGAFEELIGYSYADLDARYKTYLEVDSELVANHLTLPLMRTELSLAGAELDDAAFAQIGKCHNLNWLDLSGSVISSARIKQLAECKQLGQLFLVECRLERGALSALAQFENLYELDLSGSSIVDQDLEQLADLERLKTLRLITTRISDAGLDAIAELPNLQTVDLSNSKVSDAGLAKLKQKLPKLDAIKN